MTNAALGIIAVDTQADTTTAAPPSAGALGTRKFIARTGWSIAVTLTALDLLAISPDNPEMVPTVAVLAAAGAFALAATRLRRRRNDVDSGGMITRRGMMA